MARQSCRYLPAPTPVPTKDGRKISANLATRIHSSVYFFGEYEKALSRIVASLLKKGDVCIDVGANFGWYTTLFYKYSGDQGSVQLSNLFPRLLRN